MTYRDRLLTCPRCGHALERRTRRDMWRCAACRGVALQLGELARVFARYAPHLVTGLRPGGAPGLATEPRPTSEPPLTCAACGRGMRPVAIHGVALDRCDQDELAWLDDRALDHILDAVIADHEARKGWRRRLRDLLFAN